MFLKTYTQNLCDSTFFAGSIMAVTSSNQHAPNKGTRFVGICIQRLGCGLRANFTLRNVINHIGKEII